MHPLDITPFLWTPYRNGFSVGIINIILRRQIVVPVFRKLSQDRASAFKLRFCAYSDNASPKPRYRRRTALL